MAGKSMFFLVLSILILWYAGAAGAQGLPETTPESAGMSTARLECMERLIQNSVEDSVIAGAVTLLARRGRVVYFASHGMLDIEGGKSMPPDALFRLASMTKPVTAAAVMILYEEGRFLLGDPVSRYIPEFSEPRVLIDPDTPPYETVPAAREITIRDLLHHTSGIGYSHPLYTQAGIDLGGRNRTIGDMVRKLAGQPLMHQPGAAFTYGYNSDVLGYLVEVISGQSFDEFLREHIFEPLGMTDTFFFVPADKRDRFAAVYGQDENGGLARIPESELVHGSQSGPGAFFAGGSGLVSTASDYARFAQMLLNGGELEGMRILSPRTVSLMTTNSIGNLWSAFRANSGDKYGYGVGIRTERGEYDELESIGTFMWDGAYHTRFWVDPEQEFIGIFMSQLLPRNWRLPGLIRNTAYQAIVE